MLGGGIEWACPPPCLALSDHCVRCVVTITVRDGVGTAAFLRGAAVCVADGKESVTPITDSGKGGGGGLSTSPGSLGAPVIYPHIGPAGASSLAMMCRYPVWRSMTKPITGPTTVGGGQVEVTDGGGGGRLVVSCCGRLAA